ncbi:MAG: BF3164 family lipoprotein, partial [Bacteroidales bacterium]
KYNFNSAKKWFILRDEHYFGFRSSYLTKEHIYLSCDDTQMIDLRKRSPRPKHTYILVMDYEGNIVNKYLLDKFFALFTVSLDEKSLYAVIDDPDILISKYSL